MKMILKQRPSEGDIITYLRPVMTSKGMRIEHAHGTVAAVFSSSGYLLLKSGEKVEFEVKK